MNFFVKDQIRQLNDLVEKEPEKLLSILLREESDSILTMTPKDLRSLGIKSRKNPAGKLLNERESLWKEAISSGEILDILIPIVIEKSKHLTGYSPFVLGREDFH